MKIKKYIYSAITLASLSTFALAMPVLADTTTTLAPATKPGDWNGMGRMGHGKGGMMKPGVFGTVSSIDGTTITVSGKQGFGANATTTTFTVDATNAKIMKSGAAGTISSIAVGDMIMGQGILTGTNLVATMIRDGMPPRMNKGDGQETNESGQLPMITGNGQPVVAGTVSTLSGSTITITNKSNVTYTIDATNAKILQGQNAVSVSDVAVGDKIIVQGTVNGSAIVASSVIDQKPIATSTTSGTPGAATKGPHRGFFGSIGSFFSNIFGF